jgi:hypothetical protein
VKLDFSPVHNKELNLMEFARQFSLIDLQAATNTSIDFMLGIVKSLNDQQVVFIPHDPNAHDPHAVPGEEHIGWSVAHLVVHTTASSEEWATYSSILARGIAYPAEPRLRYETNWHTVTTQAQCIQRLEESRRIRLAYLEAWPDQPDLDRQRELSPRFLERHGPINAKAAFLFGLRHEIEHHAQIQDAARQAHAAFQAAATAD